MPHNGIVMFAHCDLDKKVLKQKLRNFSIQFAGNFKLKIFGRLNCRSGKRMKKENRVFFQCEKEALSRGFRPCGHCMRKKYRQWKACQ
jgi:methylphosphotriester-DNA--protein-cysteine methyltransferase